MGFTMGPLELSLETRRRVARDALLLTAWWAAVGFACSWLLLDIGGLRSPMWRYALTAFVMYPVGVVVGLRVWLVLFSRAVQLAPGRFGAAAADEGEEERRFSRPATLGAGLLTLWGVLYIALLLFRFSDFGHELVWTLALALALTALITSIGPSLAAGYSLELVMAEMAIRFVFGRTVGRDFLPRRTHAEALPMIVRETWQGGASFLVFSAAVGMSLILLHPGAVMIADIFP